MIRGSGTSRRVLGRFPWWRFFAGVSGGAAALLLTFLLRVLGLGTFLPEIALDFVVTRIPGSVESFFIGTMGEGAKALGLLTAVAATLAAYGLGAIPFRRLERRLPNEWALIMVYTGGTLAIVLLVVLPLLGAGLAGASTSVGVGFTILSQLLGSWLYASVVEYFLVEVAARHPEGFSPSRRQFLIGGAVAAATLVLTFYGLASLLGRAARLVFASVADMLAKEVTPTEDFYTVTKNLIDPIVEVGSWRLTVDGLVDVPASYTYGDLQARMNVEEYATMECVSDEVGGNLIGTARWKGVRLADLLSAAGLHSSADWVQLSCADGYTVGIPRARALDPATLVVLEMNGSPLTGRHGFPARVLVPGKYGMFSAKWVTRVTAVQGEVLGFWQQKGWTNAGEIRTTAIVATPPPESVVRGPVMIGGVALAGTRGISRVEVSTDDGRTWSPATLRSPLDPRLTWYLWTFRWDPPGGGAYRVRARAYDGLGVAQDETPERPFPNGAAGYDRVTLYVEA